MTGNALGDSGLLILCNGVEVRLRTLLFLRNLIQIKVQIMILTIPFRLFYHVSQKSRYLKYLSVRSNSITSIGLTGIVESLLKHCPLVVLDISNNSDIIEADFLRGEKGLRDNGVKCDLRRNPFSTALSASSTPFPSLIQSFNQETETGTGRVDASRINKDTRCVCTSYCTAQIL